MRIKLDAYKQSPSAEYEGFKAFKPHRFEVQTGINRPSTAQPAAVDWQTQLSRAKFGHNLSQVQSERSQHQVASTQGKSLLQCKVVEDEQKKDKEKSILQME